jgi:hypothetical protein
VTGATVWFASVLVIAGERRVLFVFVMIAVSDREKLDAGLHEASKRPRPINGACGARRDLPEPLVAALGGRSVRRYASWGLRASGDGMTLVVFALCGTPPTEPIGAFRARPMARYRASEPGVARRAGGVERP